MVHAFYLKLKLPVSLWGESILTAVHIIIRIPTPILQGKIRYEMLHGSPLPYDSLKVFVCLCYVHKKCVIHKF